jgi:hypothetical protein
MFLAPAIILQQNLLVKAAQTALFLVLAVISISAGKRRLVIGSVVFMLTTIIVNLFSPAGRVVVQIGPFPVTRGALEVGISKATTLAGLLYLSRLCVRPSVRLPGVAGRYISETFGFLNQLLARRKQVARRNVVRRLDELFESVSRSQGQWSSAHPDRAQNTPLGVIAMVSLLIVNWGSLFFPFSALLGEG